jgi:hypothetical protein
MPNTQVGDRHHPETAGAPIIASRGELGVEVVEGWEMEEVEGV